MPDISFERVRPLVARQEARGGRLHLTFRCPVTHMEVHTAIPVVPGMAARARQQGRPGMWSVLTGSLGATLRTLVMEPIASLSGGLRPGPVAAQPTFTPEDVEYATTEAFRRLRSQFSWDAASGRYVAANLLLDLQTEFTRILAATRIESRWDRDVLLRMLVEIATTDGCFGEEERGLLFSFTVEDGLEDRLEEIARKPPLQASDLARTTPEIREVLLMLAWAVAWSDRSLDPAEEARLASFTRGLEIEPDRAARLAGYAREHVLDQLLEAVYATGEADDAGRAKVAEVARRMGVSDVVLARLDGRCRLRKGIGAR